MAIPQNDNNLYLNPKPINEYERKNVDGTYVDWDSITELNSKVNINFRRNKTFYIDGNLYQCDNDGVTYRLIGGKDTTWETTDSFFDQI